MSSSSHSTTSNLEVARQEPKVAANDDDPTTFSLEHILTQIGTHKTQLLVILVGGLGYASFMEQGFLPTLATANIWLKWPELENDKTFYNTVFATGAICRLIGSLIFIPLNDIFGRRPMLLGSLIVLCIGCGVNAAVNNFIFYCSMRGLCMMAASILPSTTTMYTMETVSIKRRALPSTILQSFHILAIMYVTAVNMGLKLDGQSWRWLYLAALGPMVCSLILLPFVFYETPRFLVATGREDQAWKTLKRLTPGGEAGLTERLGVASIANCRIQGAEAVPPRESFLSKLKGNMVRMGQVAVNKDLRYNTALLSMLWALFAFAFWGSNSYMTTFFLYIGLASNGATLACFSVQLPGMALTYWLMTREGRFGGRLFAMKVCCFGCGSGLILLTIVLACQIDSAPAFWILSMYTYFFTGPAWNPLYAYSAEMYPTNVRGAALALFGTINGLATLITTYIGSASVNENTKWVYPLIWGSTWTVALGICFLLKTETREREMADKI